MALRLENRMVVYLEANSDDVKARNWEYQTAHHLEGNLGNQTEVYLEVNSDDVKARS